MFNMASIRIVSLCLLISSLMLDAISASMGIECTKSEIEAQFGTSTLLDCVVQTQKPKLAAVIWAFKDTEILSSGGTVMPKDPRFQFAKSSWDSSNKNVSLLITNTDLSHSGDYECRVLVGTTIYTSQVHVNVKAHYSKPIINSNPENITRDKAFSLTCEAHGGFPQGYIRWVVNDVEWNNKPEEEVHKTTNGLYSLTSKLQFGPKSVFTKFVCEVYNASKVMEGQHTLEMPQKEQREDPDNTEGKSVSHIIAPVVVIGSLIVGLLMAVLVMCRRRYQNVPIDDDPQETNQMA